MMPKVSVIVPVYNVEEYLPKCLDSLINQTLSDIEIIVVNDGSPDNSQDIIDEYKKKDKRIISIIKENKGVGSARNLGLEKTRGEYISYVDSDDYIELDMLEKMYDKAKSEDLDIVIYGYKNIYPNKEVPYIIPDNLIEETLNNKKSKIFNTVSPWSKIYKRIFLLEQDIKFVEDKVWYEDFAYSVKLLSSTNKIGIVNKPLYNYLIRENSIMNSSKLLKNLDIILAFDDVISFMKKQNKYDEFYEEIEYLAVDNILISGITRIVRINNDKKTKKEVINKFIDYIKEKFPNYKKNKYLSRLSLNRKIIYRLVLLKQYWLIRLMFKIKH